MQFSGRKNHEPKILWAQNPLGRSHLNFQNPPQLIKKDDPLLVSFKSAPSIYITI